MVAKSKRSKAAKRIYKRIKVKRLRGQKKQKINIENNRKQSQTTHIDASTQTDFDTSDQSIPTVTEFSNYKTVVNELNFENLKDLIDIFIDSFTTWKAIHTRIISVIIYILLRFCKVKYEKTSQILEVLNLMNIKTCHTWVKSMFDEDDLCFILKDERGKYKRERFYDNFPELEQEAKAYSLEHATKKKSTFTVEELARFIDKRFRELYGDDLYLEKNNKDGKLIRSKESCRVDLLMWGARWDSSKNRPYFEGHERADVVQKREEFINYFLENKHLYYSTMINENDCCKLLIPKQMNEKIRILISHDESTYRIELPPKRWLYPALATLFNKGRGRSIMVSAFLCQHSTSKLFELNENEMKNAIKKYPELNEKDDFLNYYHNSANAWIHPGKDNYFDNKIILTQFERLFKMLKFKKDFNNHDIEIIVDNATTHTTVAYDVNLISMSPGTRCPYETIEWIENGKKKIIKCLNKDNESKGLLQIAKELGLVDQRKTSKDIYLNELRNIVSKHVAFDKISNLEKLAQKYGVKIIWSPKYHCELNPIEGFWCYSKRFVRKNNEQNFNELNNLIITSKERFEESSLNEKLWNRFWNCIEMYNAGSTYREVLQHLFGAKSSDTVKSHKKNTNFNTKI